LKPVRTLVLRLGGPLELRDTDGIDLTPRARKAQGLLALLGTAPGLRRSRCWLQDKLWSDRAPEQGAASLRQCLTEIRRSLRDHVDCLIAETGWVALDSERVEVTLTPPTGPHGERGEFLEGLDVRDPEFEHWLRDQRIAHEETHTAKSTVRLFEHPRGAETPNLTVDVHRPILLTLPAEAEPDNLRLLADMLAEDVARQIAALGNASLATALMPEPGTTLFGLGVFARAAELGGTLYFQLRLNDLRSGSVVWINLRQVDPHQEASLQDGPLAQLGNEAVRVAHEELGRMADRVSDEERLALLGYQASRHTVIFDREEQIRMDAMLQRAFELEPRGIFLARRALLRGNQVYEMNTDSPEEARLEAIDLARHAYALDCDNAVVAATAAKTALNFEGKLEAGLELAQQALQLGPTLPLAWESLAVARALAGDGERAHRAALRAREFASRLPQTYCWDMVCALTATVAGRYEEAIRFAERARDLAPTFKPPLRYLIALYNERGDIEAAREQLALLKALEPDFDLRRLEDARYPAAALRRTRLIRVARATLT